MGRCGLRSRSRETREAIRPDRVAGQADSQAAVVHKGVLYDLVVSGEIVDAAPHSRPRRLIQIVRRPAANATSDVGFRRVPDHPAVERELTELLAASSKMARSGLACADHRTEMHTASNSAVDACSLELSPTGRPARW